MATPSASETPVSHGQAGDPFHGFGTAAIHAGNEPETTTGAVVPPISLATTFAQGRPGEKKGLENVNSHGNGWEYSRTGNPTRGALERQLAAVEHGTYCCAFASGMAATSAVVHTLRSGDHIVCGDDVYGGTQRYFRRVVAPNAGIESSFVDMTTNTQKGDAEDAGVDRLRAAMTDKTRLVWLETPTNPTLKIADVRKIADAVHSHGDGNVLLAVDNTFLTPYFQNPLDLGADIVVHSMTKYIGGHSDVVMGCVITNSEDIITQLRFIQNGVGAVPSPFDCYLSIRGLKTLHVRMAAAAANAQAIAEYLDAHDHVESVTYPGLASHPQHELAKEQGHGFGAMITFIINGGTDDAAHFLDSLQLFVCAESLGAVESLAESPAIMTHASVPQEQREILGISDSLIRLSVGIESRVDLINDLEQAFTAMQNARGTAA